MPLADMPQEITVRHIRTLFSSTSSLLCFTSHILLYKRDEVLLWLATLLQQVRGRNCLENAVSRCWHYCLCTGLQNPGIESNHANSSQCGSQYLGAVEKQILGCSIHFRAQQSPCCTNESNDKLNNGRNSYSKKCYVLPYTANAPFHVQLFCTSFISLFLLLVEWTFVERTSSKETLTLR